MTSLYPLAEELPTVSAGRLPCIYETYYSGVVTEFDWDEANVNHLARHGVMPSEVEEVIENDPILEVDYSSEGEERWRALGITNKARLLAVVFTVRAEKIRPITAWDLTRTERRLYEKKLYSR